MNWLLFFHLAGIIVGLGAVTVIDVMGFFARKSKKKTQDTIAAHHTTKPLIWIGTIIVAVTWMLILATNQFTTNHLYKTILLGIMFLNGSFLSFHISPRLDKLQGKNNLLPSTLQQKITVSLVVSFLSWWSFVLLTVGEF